MKIFDLKIMTMIKYGMKIISPNLAKVAMENLDRCKSAYIKTILGVGRNTSNTFILVLMNQKTICETNTHRILKENGRSTEERSTRKDRHLAERTGSSPIEATEVSSVGQYTTDIIT